ncbi:MAG TPA: DJ-1/PfpI family protein [Planctomycetota bacterium]
MSHPNRSRIPPGHTVPVEPGSQGDIPRREVPLEGHRQHPWNGVRAAERGLPIPHTDDSSNGEARDHDVHASLEDHFSQARSNLHSRSAAEREHPRDDAGRSGLAKVELLAFRARIVALYRRLDRDLAHVVAIALRVGVPGGLERARPSTAGGMPVESSDGPSLVHSTRDPIRTRRIAVLVADGVRADDIDLVSGALSKAGARVEVISTTHGHVRARNGRAIDVDKTLAIAPSIFYHAVYVPGGAASVSTLCASAPAVRFVREAFALSRAVGATREGVELLTVGGVPLPASGHDGVAAEHGVVVAADGSLEAFASFWIAAIRQHRHFEREHPPRSRG